MELCAARGAVGLFPLDAELAATPGERLDYAIYRANVALMREADAAIANLTPFRGVSADPGTVFEVGLMTGWGKPVWGYSNASADLLGRMRDAGGITQGVDGRWVDELGMSVEDFGNADNLMIDASLALARRPLVRRDVPQARLYHDLEGFARCLDLARAELIEAG